MNLNHKTICLNKWRILKWTDLLVLILKWEKVYCTAMFSLVVKKLPECISCKYTIIIFSVPKINLKTSPSWSPADTSCWQITWHTLGTDYTATNTYTHTGLYYVHNIGWTLDRKGGEHLYQQWRVWRTSNEKPKSNFLLTSSWVWNHLCWD